MMMPFLAQLPEDTQRILEGVSPLSWDGIDVKVRPLTGLGAFVPQSKVWSGLKYVVGKMRGSRRSRAGLKAVGATIGETIYIDPDFADWNTAAGLALLAHERLHVEQKRTIPGFDELYAEAQATVHPQRPWENPYEMDAYQRECQVYYRLVAEGVPPGSWVPLGVAMGFCAG
jgi:hypothetical protein